MIMGREEHRGAGRVDLFEERQNVDREVRVEVTRGLVCQDERWLGNDRTRHGDALLLTAGEVAGPLGPGFAVYQL